MKSVEILPEKIEPKPKRPRRFPFFPNRFSPAWKLFRLVLAAIVFYGSAGAVAGDDPLVGNLKKDDPTQPWHITADQLSYDDKAEQYIGQGNVVVTKQGKKLTADFIRFDQVTMDVFAAGHAIMTVGEDVIAGNRMEMNLNTEIGTVYDGSIFISENHFYITGDTLQKLGEKTYAADRATVTSCKGPNPDWVITGRNLKVTIDGLGVADHAALWAKNVPVFYTPFLVFPAKKTRQTGFLFPALGFGDRLGFTYNQPFFWAINDHSDATFYFQHMADRGEKIGLEYRYILDEDSQGAVMVDGFHDKETDDGTPGETDKWGYWGDSAARPNKGRYWFRMKHDQQLPNDFTAKLDLDIVSDQDYLHEFRTGFGGFNESDAYFHEHFGRDLDDYDDAVRLNRFNINRTWSRFSFNAEARWYDDVINRQLYDTNTILQKLPFVEFNASKQQIFDTPFYANLDSEYVHFYKEDKDEAHRIDAYPRIFLPMNYKHYFSFEPSVGLRGTVWYVGSDNAGDSPDDDFHSRAIYDVKTDLSSEIYKVFHTQGKRLKAIKHAIRPQVIYRYTPEEDQSDYPYYTGIDRIGEANKVTYSLTNTFTAKSAMGPVKEKDAAPDDTEAPVQADAASQYTYREFCRFKIQQSYDINEAIDDDVDNREPFSPIYAELNFSPVSYLSFRGDASRSPYKNYFNTHNVSVWLNDNRGDRLFLEHRYTHKSSESIYVDLRVKITERLSTYTQYEKNLFDDEAIRTGLGLLYQTPCWSLKCDYTKEEDDQQFAFMINLVGLGEFRQNILAAHHHRSRGILLGHHRG